MPPPTEYFPYPQPKKFQDEFMHVAFTSDRLIANVPTGMGKSVASLCGFLADMLPREKVVVLTRTKSQAEIFLEESRRIKRKSGWGFLALQMKSKQELCPIFSRGEAGYEEFLQLCKLKQDCRYRELFRERAKDAIFLAEELVRGTGEERALEYGCPYLVNLELAKLAKVVIASYQYLFSPFLRDFFLNKLGIGYGELLLIIDEAHNLQNMSLLSRSLSHRTLKLAEREVGFNFSVLEQLFKAREGKVALEEIVSRAEVEELYQLGVESLRRKLDRGRKVSHAYRVASFLDTCFRLRGDENWLLFRQKNALHLKPVLPSELFSPLRQSRKLLLMSGTLEPLNIYSKLLDLEEAEEYTIPNIYRNSLRYLAIRSGINSSLAARRALGDELWDMYAQVIEEIASSAQGTALVFLPSYEIMRAVGRRLPAMLEPRDSIEAENLKREILKHEKNIVLAVAGGKFSEGVEFTQMKGGAKHSLVGTVIIAGLPFPRPDMETELKREVYEEKFGPGKSFLFLSVLPMVNRVMQASGRAVRSERDRACVVILDDRLQFLRYLPEDIRQSIELVELEEVASEVKRFANI